jgi:hypothetical protein
MILFAGKPVPKRTTKALTKLEKAELLFSMREAIRKSHDPVPKWKIEEMSRLEKELDVY